MLTCCCLFCSAYSRRLIHEYELYYRDGGGRVINDAFKFNVVITTYEVMMCESANSVNIDTPALENALGLVTLH